ncbi:MAG: hypothetical protein MUC65_02570 [Pontiellaceae bacterium]|jgi:sugar lactone lactonase YvrE|nr:hypothetical protein [Pontiellaceae bacterium]
MEQSQGKPVKADQKKHLIVTYKGEPGGFGADGMDFDQDGNLYVGLFSSGQFFKTTFNRDGSVDKTVCLIDSLAFRCCDGTMYDKATDKIYTTDSKMNAVWVYDLKRHTIQRLWENPDATGEDGSLDQPCEPLIYGDSLLVVNFDYIFPD